MTRVKRSESMKKKGILILIVIIIIAIIASVLMYLQKNNLWIFDKYKDVDLDPNEIFERIYEGISLPSMVDENMENIKDLYNGIDEDKITSYSVNISFMNIRADEIAIFKVNDKNYLKELRKILEDRAINVQNSFKDYIYEQYEVSRKYKIMTYGDVIMLIITNSNDDILKIVDDMIFENENI